MPWTPLGRGGALGQTGNGEHGEASLGTFCSWKRPSMMLLHRSSSRLRSTMWSRTSSSGLAAGRPRKVLLARVLPNPPGPASGTRPLSTPLTWVSGPGLLSHPHKVPDVQLAHRVGHMQPLQLEEQLWPVPRPGAVRQEAQIRAGPCHRPPSILSFAARPHSPLGFANVHTQQHPVLSRPKRQWRLLDTPFAGATIRGRGVLVCLRPEHQCQAAPPPPPPPPPPQPTVGGAARL